MLRLKGLKFRDGISGTYALVQNFKAGHVQKTYIWGTISFQDKKIGNKVVRCYAVDL